MLFVGRKPVKIWRVPSKSEINPDTGTPIDRLVELWGDGKMTCDCPSYRVCYHVKNTKENILKEFGSIEKAIENYKL